MVVPFTTLKQLLANFIFSGFKSFISYGLVVTRNIDDKFIFEGKTITISSHPLKEGVCEMLMLVKSFIVQVILMSLGIYFTLSFNRQQERKKEKTKLNILIKMNKPLTIKILVVI